MLCACVKDGKIGSIEKANLEADLIEIRLDLIPECTLEAVSNLKKKARLPVIFKGTKDHLPFLQLQPDYIDLPFEEQEHFSKVDRNKTKLIVSIHDFEKTPDGLERIYEVEADLYKVACTAERTVDGLKMLLFLKNQRKPTVALSMGEKGAFTRVLGPIFGAPFTYAALDLENQTAPSQYTLDELKGVFHHDRLNKNTKIYGLLGDPIAKSVSHIRHNFLYRKLDVNAVYVLLHTPKEDLKETLALSEKLGINGFSVTIPLKKEVSQYLDKGDGAINTVAFENGKRHGWNTDGPAALDCIEKRIEVKGKTLCILGAGGVALGIAEEAFKRGATIKIFNRTLSTAKEVAAKVNGQAYSLEQFPEEGKKGYDVLINCTSLGMYGEGGMAILKESMLKKKVILETVSNPERTLFFETAEQKECQCISGIEMFLAQAALQYVHWWKLEQ